jgi:hypothetical protein
MVMGARVCVESMLDGSVEEEAQQARIHVKEYVATGEGLVEKIAMMEMV